MPVPLANAQSTLKTDTLIFFSYAWNEASDELVLELYDSLKQEGYNVILDKKDLEYRDLISTFMKSIGKGQYIIVLLSDKYLRSDNCMFELSEIYRNSKLEKEELRHKIYPIRVEPLNLNDPQTLRRYLAYWKNRESEYQHLVSEYKYDQGEHRKIEAINQTIRDLLPFLNDINSSRKDLLAENDFRLIKQSITDMIVSAQ